MSRIGSEGKVIGWEDGWMISRDVDRDTKDPYSFVCPLVS